MLATSKSMKVKNPAAVLSNEDGIFEVTSPTGDVFCVICEKGVGMTFSRLGDAPRARASASWQIRRRENSKVVAFPCNPGRPAA